MYDKETMYTHVVRLTRYNNMHWWVQDEIYGPQNRRHFWRELSDFCWLVYDKAYNSIGPAYIGRIVDMQEIRYKICNIIPGGIGLLHEDTKGNALSFPKWAPILNDAWTLGHIHRRAKFILVSPRSPVNLWENSMFRQGVTITGRELIGLQHFGYERRDSGIHTEFFCSNPFKANESDLIEYNVLMEKEDKKRMGSILKFIGLNHQLLNEIKNFNKNDLKIII
jgi:hypothetical protein